MVNHALILLIESLCQLPYGHLAIHEVVKSVEFHFSSNAEPEIRRKVLLTWELSSLFQSWCNGVGVFFKVSWESYISCIPFSFLVYQTEIRRRVALIKDCWRIPYTSCIWMPTNLFEYFFLFGDVFGSFFTCMDFLLLYIW